jgi:inner membrane protein
MDPLTHFLTGACIGRSGFNRKTAYATVAAVLAAEAADIDVLWGLAGPVEQLKHHRGITHTLIAAPVVAGAVVGAVWLFHAWRKIPRKSDLGGGTSSGFAPQPVHWGWLYLTAIVAALSHLLLDWSNSYGLRPFYPFDSRWFAGSFLFIIEPELWALLLLALIMPWLLGLTDREIGARRVPFRGRGWALFALAGMLALGCWRFGERSQAAVMVANTQVTADPVVRMTLEPYPLNPYRWHAILETKNYYQTAEVNTWNPYSLTAIESNANTDVIYKPPVTPAVEAAKRTFLGRVYLDWGTWAVVRDAGQQPVPALAPPTLPPGETWTTVTFSDLRFDYPFLPTRSPRNVLSGWVYIVNGRDEAGEGMGDRVQK